MPELDFHEIERKWAVFWEKNGTYDFDEKSKAPAFVIDTPPPTVSGKMHLGHAFSYAQADMVARYQRMTGKNVFYPFGLDDNGLPTERMVEKNLKIRAKDFSRKEFIKMCLEETKKAEAELQKDFSSLGLSIEWKRIYRTIDRNAQVACQKSFLEILKKNRAYQKTAPTMWCPKCETAIAQAELEDLHRNSELVFVKAEVEGEKEIVFATTRPELLFACVCISVHPDDNRFKGFVGKKAKIPISNKWVPIIADEETKMDFGSGAVYWCPFGDIKDLDFLERHKEFEPVTVIGKDGKLNEKNSEYAGQKVEEARKKIIEDLKKIGVVEKTEKIDQTVNVHERCKSPIEILTSKQWFIRYLDLKKKFLGQAKKIEWRPKHMKNRYDNWVKGLKWDWNISRQRFFGVPIPVWHCKKCGELKFPQEKDLPVDPSTENAIGICGKCGFADFEGEKDVFDTWATSSLTPQIALNWINDKKFFSKHFPMSLRPQAHDIINLWAFYTIAKAFLHEEKIPWENIMISGHALDPHGRKMSKSLGNVIEPKEVLQKYSADVLRYWAATASLGEDLAYQEKELVAGKKFATKIFNAAKFVDSATNESSGKKINEKNLELKVTDKWILSRLQKAKKEATLALEEYEFSRAISAARNFFWLDFADYYIEEIKHRVYGSDKESKLAAQFVLRKVFFETIKLFAPFTPFIAEEIAHEFFSKEMMTKSIHTEQWPLVEKNLEDAKAEKIGEEIKLVISVLRREKTKKQLPLNAEIKSITLFGVKNLNEGLEEIASTMKAKKAEIKTGKGEITVSDNLSLSIEF